VPLQAQAPHGQCRRQPKGRDEQTTPVRASVTTISDTGPLGAFLNRNDPYHDWAVTRDN